MAKPGVVWRGRGGAGRVTAGDGRIKGRDVRAGRWVVFQRVTR